MSEDQLKALLDKDEISAVIHRVARGTDRLDRALIVSGYHPDGFDDHNSFRGDPEAFADWVLEVLPTFSTTHHFLGQIDIELAGDVAHVETYCQAHHVRAIDEEGAQHDMVLGLRYIDRFERREGPWLIAHRVCALDWSENVITKQPWTFGEDFTVGVRSPGDVSYERRP